MSDIKISAEQLRKWIADVCGMDQMFVRLTVKEAEAFADLIEQQAARIAELEQINFDHALSIDADKARLVELEADAASWQRAAEASAAEVSRLRIAVNGSEPVTRDWRVGLFKSSSNPGKQVRVLADGAAQIAEHEKHHSFVRWIDEQSGAAAKSDLTEQHFEALDLAIRVTRAAGRIFSADRIEHIRDILLDLEQPK
ncbi:hypothetical protein G3N95_29780 [Paraburkholderia sp. Tr-20389]|uniref:hypothetical protein n=1 Tax=Paraburkholderia sp. Tr-20389 TaxID=2703903 RepID=UPI00197FDD18|nr:hypothetical protein [Paraburkholderia sp. Tr-20389]MBN3757165.1 hypothetical protein [Paraburkholderia sp. Tr-20389]